MPWLIELIFNTPSHHRVHHASNIRYLDCNHGGILIIWDRLFGTFSEEVEEEPVVYGLTSNIHTDNPWRVLCHEYQAIARDVRRAESWRDRLRVMASRRIPRRMWRWSLSPISGPVEEGFLGADRGRGACGREAKEVAERKAVVENTLGGVILNGLHYQDKRE